MITDFKWGEGDKINVAPTSVTYFGGQDSTPELNEVSYWFSGTNTTVVSYNDGGVIHDVMLQNLHLDMIASDFIV